MVDVPPQCQIKTEPSMEVTRNLFMVFWILWVVLHTCNLCRTGGILLYRDGVYVLIVLAFSALAFVLWPLTNPDHACEGAVATCSTISCVCGNLIWQGYVWMFVVIVLNAFILLKALAKNLNTYVTKLPNRDKSDSRVEQCNWGTLMLFVALLLSTITGIFPSLKRDPQDTGEWLKRSLDDGHTYGVAGAGMFGVFGILWCKVNTWQFYNAVGELKKEKLKAEKKVTKAIEDGNAPEIVAQATIDKNVRVLEYETMMARRNRENSFFFFDVVALALTLSFAIAFAASSKVPKIFDSHLCSKWGSENDCLGDNTNFSDVGLAPWVCVWVDDSANGQAARQANFKDTDDCAYGCCFSNAACYDTALYPELANHLNQENPDDKGKCRANQNARVMVLEFLLLGYLLLNVANHLSSKVHDDVFLEIKEAGPLSAKFNTDPQWWWVFNPFSSKYIIGYGADVQPSTVTRVLAI
eukprot:m.149695 g.149695  ORF g.149695 m.149695 type:complete len:468 (-) comp30676_c1_seq1:139-1542(-)